MVPGAQLFFSLPIFALILMRITGLVLAAPILGSKVMPFQIRGALVLALSAMVFPVLHPHAPTDLTLASALFGAVGELSIGVAIGLSLTIMMSGMELAGRLVGEKAGLSLAEIYDPTFGQESGVLGQVYYIVLSYVFLVIGGHRDAVQALLDSFRAVPMFTYAVDSAPLDLLVDVMTAAFVLAIRLAAPVLVAVFIATVVLGLISRTLPQLNVLTIGFTLNVLIVVALGGVVIALAGDLLVGHVDEVIDRVRLFAVDGI